MKVLFFPFSTCTGGLAGDNVESLLPIVASQRERFKVRNMELEAVGFPLGCTNLVFCFVCFFVFLCRRVPYCLQALGIKDKFSKTRIQV